MRITQTKKYFLSPQALFMTGLLLILAVSLTVLGTKADAASSTDTYTDNAGGQQQIRVTRAKGENRPAIILVHGGGWFSDGGEWGQDFQNRAADWGYTTFRIKYRLMSGGVYEQLEDVMRAIRHVRDNAANYGIDPNKVALWGDSAGGSLTVRAAATGRSGVRVAVGWSAPTNAFRDLFNSYDGWVAGLYHSRCLGEYIPPFVQDAINFGIGNRPLFDKLIAGGALTPQESGKLLGGALNIAGLAIEQMPVTAGKLKKAENDFGVSVNPEVLTGDSSGSGSSSSYSESDIRSKLQNLSGDDLARLGAAIYKFGEATQTTDNQADDVVATIDLMKQALTQLTNIQSSIVQEKANAGDTPTTTTTSSSSSTSSSSESQWTAGSIGVEDPSELISIGSGSNSSVVGINPQQISADKIAQCIDDFVQMSPALFASPRTPPMMLVGASHERWVNPLDAYQMRDKLRSMGIRSEALILPKTTKTVGDGHMGYDPRAEAPSFRFTNSVINP